jgi:hypothetical protein
MSKISSQIKTIGINELYKNIELIMVAGLVPLVQSSPGIGKTSVARMFGFKNRLKLIDVRLATADPTDLTGFPRINQQTNRAEYVPFNTFPVEGDPLPMVPNPAFDSTQPESATNAKEVQAKGWLIVFDEITSAVPALQAAAYKILLEREVGLLKLHPRVKMIGLGNRMTDNAVVSRMSTALQSRLIHLVVTSDRSTWCDWAYSAGVFTPVISFLNSRPQLLNSFEPDHNDNTFPCERTWEFVSKLCKTAITLNQPINLEMLPVIAGAIGQGAAQEFLGFMSIYNDLIPLSEIVADPARARIPNEPAGKWAITGVIADGINATNVDRLVVYLQRLATEFQIITLQQIFALNPAVLKTPGAIKYATEMSKYLIRRN